MRAEVRADYEAALEWVQGDDAFAVRFERFFTELRDPLRTLYGDDERFAGAWERLLRAICTTREYPIPSGMSASASIACSGRFEAISDVARRVR